MEYIYSIRHKDTKKRYIGRSINPEQRLFQHKSDAKSKTRKTHSYLHNAIAKHGIEAFEFEVIAGTRSEDVGDLEKYYIRWYQTLAPLGYNLREGGEGGAHSEATKLAMRKPKRVTEEQRRASAARLKALKGRSSLVNVDPIAQYTLDGNFVALHGAITHAGAALGKGKGCAINRVFGGKARTAYGFLWRRHLGAEPPAAHIEPYVELQHYNLQPVECWSLGDSPELLATYPSGVAAEAATGAWKNGISLCCRGKGRTAGGFGWRFAS